MADPSPAGTVPAPASDPGAVPAAPAGAGPAAGPSAADLIAAAQADWARQLKEATGHASIADLAAATKAAADKALAEQGEFRKLHEAASTELAQVRADLTRERVRGAIAGAAAEAVDAEVVHALLSAQASVGADGAVTIGGKTPAAAVAALLAERPYLARPAGGQGSGAGAGSAAGAGAGRTLTRGAFDALTPQARVAHIQAGGLVTEG